MNVRSLVSEPRALGFVTLTSTLLVQAAHEYEHVLQMLQKYRWNWRVYPGLLGQWFDFEWIHMLYNGALWIALLASLIIFRKNPGMWRPTRLGEAALYFLVLFQGYHWFEHLVRIYQYMVLGLPKPRGILGHFISLLELHFGFATIVSMAIVIAYVLLRPWPRVERKLMMTVAESS